MNRKDIEARLERSLTNQIKVRQLDRGFDSAVWSRIAGEAAAKAPEAASELSPERAARVARASRWLAVSNAIGATVVIALLAYFGLKMFGGVTVDVSIPSGLTPPTLSDAVVEQAVTTLGYVLGFATLLGGLAVTPVGQRLRAAFS